MNAIKKAVIKHSSGLHARLAAMVVHKAHEVQQKYNVTLYFHYRDRKNIPANSLILLISLRIKGSEEFWISAEGEQPERAINEMAEFLASDFRLKDDSEITEVDKVLQDNAVTAEQIFNSMANGLIAINENDLVTIFNPAAERIMGLAATHVIGRDICEAIPDTRLPIVRRTMQAELSSRQTIGNRVIITNRTPIVVDGQAKGALAIFEDVSSLEKALGELKEVKELKESLHLILETVQDGICVVDKTGVITYVNPAYLRIVGQPLEQIVGKNVDQISPAGARKRVLTTGRPVLGSISHKANGQTVVANINPILIDGEVEGVVSVVKNISEVQNMVQLLSEANARAEYFEHELRRTRKPIKVFGNFIGSSGKIIDALAIAAKASEGMATVLIHGESGTGKELVAEGIHFASSRGSGPFIRVNCAAIPSTLLESELFGYEKGAFTGAVRRKPGMFELADKGTIFLDEIGELEKSMQAKLLRVLHKKEFQRLGGQMAIKADVRIIAATNRDLAQMVADGTFREDLYYRLNIIPIFLPPLRQRTTDIPLLVEHFLIKICGEHGKEKRAIRQDALDLLVAYHWPGNVREMENLIERIITLSDNAYITIEDLPSYLQENLVRLPEKTDEQDNNEEIRSWAEYEKDIIRKALNKYASFNKAAKALGLTHKTVAAKARKYGLAKDIRW